MHLSVFLFLRYIVPLVYHIYIFMSNKCEMPQYIWINLSTFCTCCLYYDHIKKAIVDLVIFSIFSLLYVISVESSKRVRYFNQLESPLLSVVLLSNIFSTFLRDILMLHYF